MIPVDLSLLFFLLLVVLNYRVHRSVLYPPFIFCAMWLLDLAVIRSNLIELDPIHANTLAIVAGGAVSFSVGGLLAGFTPQELLRIHLFPPKPEKVPDLFRNALMIFLICGLPFMLYETWRLSNSQGGGFNILMQARLALLEATENGESRSYASRLMAIAIGASLLFATEKKDRQFWVVTGVAFITCILSTGRTSILLLISGLSTIWILQMKQESFQRAMRLLRWPIALFVTLYIVLIFTNKSVTEWHEGATDVATSYVLNYISAPTVGFDKVVQNPKYFISTANYTFQYPLSLAATLHLINYTPPPTIDVFVFVPFPTNVYTVLKYYFLELGIYGTVGLLFSVGLLHSLLYLKAREGGKFSLYLFAFSIDSELVVIFGDYYANVGSLVHAFWFGLLYFLIGSLQLRLFPANKQGQLSSQTGQ
jgi:oligosaccharide repeat unit polymerase